MDKPELPNSAVEFARYLHKLRLERRERNAARRAGVPVRRKALTKKQRSIVLSKTDGRCHLCGGIVETQWEADHVLCHSGGGQHLEENYLAAHGLCNGYRWDYSPEEFQWVLKIGVWARTLMEKNRSQIGSEMAEEFFKHESNIRKRRVRR